MTKKLIFCAIAGAFTAQVWMMISWTALPWHFSDFKQFIDDEPVAEEVKAQATESGIYMLPNHDLKMHQDESIMEEFHDKMAQGPYAYMVVLPEGVEPNMPKMMGMAFLLNLFMAGVLYWLLSLTAITDDKRKVMFIAVAGTLGAIHPILSQYNWWFFPCGSTLVNIADLAITWTLVGLAMVMLNKKLST